MKKLFFITVAFFLFVSSAELSAQKSKNKKSKALIQIREVVPQEKDYSNDLILEKFSEYYSKGIQEKIYLHTDKPYYTAGENIWFKGYLVDEITQTQSYISNFIYVELLNNDSIITKAKVLADSLHRFHNNINLSPDLPQGQYILRAYTKWMMNAGPEMFFTKTIEILEPSEYKTEISYKKDNDGSITMTLLLKTKDGVPVSENELEYSLWFGEMKTDPAKKKTNDRGEVRIDFVAPSDTDINIIELKSDNLNFIKRIHLPAFSDDVDIQFLPEGGTLVHGNLQKIAFKAIGSNGMGVNIKGKLYNNDQFLMDFESVHKGMGCFFIMPKKDSKFHVEIETESGIKKLVNLDVSQSGCPIKVTLTSRKIFYELFPTADIDPTKLSVIINSRGQVIEVSDYDDGKLTKAIMADEFYPGVANFSVVDKETMSVISERMIFIRDSSVLNVKLIPDKENYKQREQVRAIIKIAKIEDETFEGDFSMSVTESNVVKLNPGKDNIESYLLLTSDLKGHIEEPSHYFSDTLPRADEKLDLLMLTQGWKRYDIEDILKERVTEYAIPPEKRQSITGSVKRPFGVSIKNASLYYFDQQFRLNGYTNIGEDNRFEIEDVDVRDSVWVYIQSKNKSGGNNFLDITIDKDTLPIHSFSFIKKSYLEQPSTVILDEYVKQSGIRRINRGFMSEVDIDEIIVREKKQPDYFKNNPTHKMDEKMLKSLGNIPLRYALTMLPGVEYDLDDGKLYKKDNFRDYHGEIIRRDIDIIKDNVLIPFSTVQNLSISQFSFIGLVENFQHIHPASRTNINIILRSREGAAAHAASYSGSAIVRNLGYKSPVQFYQPKYELAEEIRNPRADNRTTIAWLPTLIVDQNGEAEVKFYTADKDSDYDVVIEGITKTGKPVFYRTIIHRNDGVSAVLSNP